MDFNLDEIIFSWKEDHERHLIPVDSDERVMSIVNLMNNLRHKYGKDDDYLKGSTLRNKILEASIGLKSEGKKRSGWEKAVTTDILRALKKIGLIPSLEDLRHMTVETATTYPSSAKKSSTELPKEANGEDSEDEDSAPITEYRKEVDRSIFKDAPAPDVDWDLELCKKIGYNPNE